MQWPVLPIFVFAHIFLTLHRWYFLDHLLTLIYSSHFPFFDHKKIQVENTDNGTLFSKIETNMFSNSVCKTIHFCSGIDFYLVLAKESQ